MTRMPTLAGPARKAQPDVYTVLLLIGIIFLLTASILVSHDLIQNYGLSFGQLFTGAAGLAK